MAWVGVVESGCGGGTGRAARQDVGCVRFLNRSGYDYACELCGVYRDDVHTYVRPPDSHDMGVQQSCSAPDCLDRGGGA